MRYLPSGTRRKRSLPRLSRQIFSAIMSHSFIFMIYPPGLALSRFILLQLQLCDILTETRENRCYLTALCAAFRIDEISAHAVYQTLCIGPSQSAESIRADPICIGKGIQIRRSCRVIPLEYRVTIDNRRQLLTGNDV